MSASELLKFVHGLCTIICALVPAATVFAEQGTIRIVNGTSVVTNADYVVGNTGPYNQLVITNAGSLFNAFGTIGANSAAASNSVIVTGVNSLWYNSGNLIIGSGGSFNTLLITNGGRVSSASTVLGGDGSHHNSAVISGPTTRWDCGYLNLGYGGSSNEVSLLDGAQMSERGDVTIGVAGVGNRMLVAGTNTSFLPGRLFVGHGGFESILIISNGARVNSVRTTIGYESDGNTLECSGAGTVFETGLWEYSVGAFGSRNTLIVADGATATGGAAIGGLAIGGTNGVIVRGSNALWRGGAWIGPAGTGNFFEIIDGGTAIGGDFGIGNPLSSTQAGNWLRVAGGFLNGNVVAYSGHIVLDNGSLTAGVLDVSRQATASLSFNGGLLSTTNSAINGGAAPFAIGTSTTIPAYWQVLGTSNSLQATGGIMIGQSPGVVGRIDVTGPTAQLAIDGPVFLGSNGVTMGRGTIYIHNGGLLRVYELTTGSDGTGALTNDGGILLFSNTPSLFNHSEDGIVITNGTVRFRDTASAVADVSSGYPIKFQGENTLELDNSSYASLGMLVLQRNASFPYSKIKLIGGTSSVHCTGLVIGEGGLLSVSNSAASIHIADGAMTITNGGRFFAGGGTGAHYVGSACDSSDSVVRVVGTNSVLSIDDSLFVGCSGSSNRLIIGSGGQVSNLVGLVGFDTNSEGNLVVVSDPGSAWRNSGPLVVGAAGLSNTLGISNGAVVSASTMHIGSNAMAQGNAVLVDAAHLRVTGTITVGSIGSRNRLEVRDSSEILADGLVIGSGSLAQESAVDVHNSYLAMSRNIDLRSGFLRIEAGTISARSLLLTSLQSSFAFRSGVLTVRDVTSANGQSFIVGDGISPAVLKLGDRPSSFANGMLISSNASVIPSSSLTGMITNVGTLAPTNSPTGVLINGSLIQQLPGKCFFFANGPQRYTQYGSLKITGTAFLDGSIQIAFGDGFVPHSTNIFTLMEFTNSVGSFANVANGGRLLTSDGTGSLTIVVSSTNIYATDFRFDRDGDGIDDAWAVQHFGHTPLSQAERNGDNDGDGASNSDEFRAGTNPNDPESVFRIGYFRKNPLQTAMRFTGVSNYTYSVWVSSNLVNWKRVTEPAFQMVSTNLFEWQDDATGGSLDNQRFYMISTP